MTARPLLAGSKAEGDRAVQLVDQVEGATAQNGRRIPPLQRNLVFGWALQMAGAPLVNSGGDRLVVRSAGTAPADKITPVAVEAMAEVAIDITHVVIAMGCGTACPLYAGKRYEDWEFADPPTQPLKPSARSATTFERVLRRSWIPSASRDLRATPTARCSS